MSNGSSANKGVIYARVSTDEQKKSGYSIPSQIRLLEEKMKSDGVVAVRSPIIDAESARNMEGKGLKELLELARSHSIDYVYVYDLDRLGRNVAETPYLMYKLKEETGVVVRTLTEEYNFQDPIDFVLAALKCYAGDVESRKIGERTQRGKVEKFRTGKWVAPTPFGYMKNENGELSKIPELELIVADIFRTYQEKLNLKEVTKIVNAKYSHQIGRFSVNQIKSILVNSVYSGRPKYAGFEVPAPQLAMVAIELFRTVQGLLRTKAGKSKVKVYRKPRSILDDFAQQFGMDHVMRVLNILKPHCSRCGKQMVGNGSKIVKGLRVPSFMCQACKRQVTIPSAAQLDHFRPDLLCCPNCRSVENFDIVNTFDGFSDHTCRRCGSSFRLKTRKIRPQENEMEGTKHSATLDEIGSQSSCTSRHNFGSQPQSPNGSIYPLAYDQRNFLQKSSKRRYYLNTQEVGNRTRSNRWSKRTSEESLDKFLRQEAAAKVGL